MITDIILAIGDIPNAYTEGFSGNTMPWKKLIMILKRGNYVRAIVNVDEYRTSIFLCC
jgi:hypothetical protein